MNPAPSPTVSPRRRALRLGLALLILGGGLPLLLGLADRLRPNDFAQYWATARLLLQGQNPYDFQKILALQSAAGLPTAYSLPTYYPPWALPLLLPFGLFEFHTGQMLWLLLQSAVVLLCAGRIWALYGQRGPAWPAILLAFTFMPTFAALGLTGQISPLLLLGATGLLAFIQQPRREWLAGVSVALLAIKPPAFYLVFLALALWAWQKRRPAAILGLGATLGLSALLSFLINPLIPLAYLRMVSTYPLSNWATPTLGYWLRLWLAPTAFWLQFIGPLIGATWLAWLWFRERSAWDWPSRLPELLLVSAVTAFYTFTYDHVALLLPLLAAFAALSSAPRLWQRAGLLFHLALNGLYLYLHLRLDDSWFLWHPLALLAFYAIIKKAVQKPQPAFAS